MKFFYGIASFLFLSLLAGCEKNDGTTDDTDRIKLENLSNAWVVKSYETASQMGTGNHVTTTTLDGTFTVTFYDDMLATIADGGKLLAEGQFVLDAARLQLRMSDFTIYEESNANLLDETLISLITSYTLQIESLTQNNMELSLQYSDNATITAQLTRGNMANIAGTWQYSHHEGAMPATYAGAVLKLDHNQAFTVTTANDAITGTYAYTTGNHTLVLQYNGTSRQCDAVCSQNTLRVMPEGGDYTIYFTK